MSVVLTAALILLFIAALGATIALAAVVSETLGRRAAIANVIDGAESLLRKAAC